MTTNIDESAAQEAAVSGTTTYANAVGTFVHSFRKERGLTLDMIGQAGREFGATWSASSVRNIEQGQASLTLPALITLALALGRLSGEPLRLADLLGSAELLDAPHAEGRPVLRTWVELVLSGHAVELADADLGHALLIETDPTASLAEQRAAQKLGIPARELQQRAADLWGHPLETEALSRAGTDSTPQARGRVTRLLIDELRDETGTENGSLVEKVS